MLRMELMSLSAVTREFRLQQTVRNEHQFRRDNQFSPRSDQKAALICELGNRNDVRFERGPLIVSRRRRVRVRATGHQRVCSVEQRNAVARGEGTTGHTVVDGRSGFDLLRMRHRPSKGFRVPRLS